MLLFYIQKIKKKKDNIKVKLIYKPSEEARFRLSKALSMLFTEKDIIDYIQRFSINTVCAITYSILVKEKVGQKDL